MSLCLCALLSLHDDNVEIQTGRIVLIQIHNFIGALYLDINANSQTGMVIHYNYVLDGYWSYKLPQFNQKMPVKY